VKKILITGGAGFIGFHLCQKFINKGYKVDLIDNFKRGMIDFSLKKLLENKNVNLIKTNLLILNLKDWKIDYDKIFHLAAIIGVKHVNKNPKDVLTQNIYLLDNVIKIANKQKKLTKFMFFSTSEVYSGTLRYYGLKIPTPENTNLTVDDLNRNRTSYMLSKIYGELMCNISKNLPHTNIRPHNFYGPRMGFSHVIPELLKKMHETKNGKINIMSPNHKRTFCYILDAVEMIYQLSITNKSTHNTYNLGSSKKSISIFQLAKVMAQLFDKKILLIKSKTEAGSPINRQPDMRKFKKIINLNSEYNLENGIMDTYNWYLENIFIKNKKTFI
jgi:UDP-glucose 4-epimerase